MAERSGEESLVVKEYRKKEDEDSVFTLRNRDRTKDKGKQKVRISGHASTRRWKSNWRSHFL
jgi:hypothetical protein